MTENERAHLFFWLQRNSYYEDSLKNEEETQVFHARFNPDNQYEVTTKYKRKTEKHRAFMYNDKYYTKRNTWIENKYITNIQKLNIDDV